MLFRNVKKVRKDRLNKKNFLDSLEQLAKTANEKNGITIEDTFNILSGKGYATLLVLFSFPFCIPITIPGFSTPFGLMLCFFGMRIAFGKTLWWPKWVLEKKLTSKQVEKWTNKTINAVCYFQKVLHPRIEFLTKNPLLYRLHGFMISFLAILLSLPLPIPMSNMLAAFPIFFMGLGLLEDDGLMIIISYFLTGVCFLTFLGLFLFGKAYLSLILPQ